MYFNKKDILFIEIGQQAVRGVVIRYKEKKLNILGAAEINCSADKVIDDNIHQLIIKLGIDFKKVVICSDEVKFLFSELPIFSEEKLSPDKILEAAKWEIAPYLDFPVQEGLFGYQLHKGDQNKETTSIFITAISKQSYNNFNEICNRLNLELQNIYPKGFLSLFALTKFPVKGKYRIIFNVTKTLIITALVSSDGPIAIHESPIHSKDSLYPIAKSLVAGLSVPADKIEGITITGEENEYIEIVFRLFQTDSKIPVRLLEPKRDIKELVFVNKDLKIEHQFASILGTAIMEFRIFSDGHLGINDHVLLLNKIKNKIYTLPVALVGGIALIFLIHYFIIKISLYYYSSNIPKMENKKKEIETASNKLIELTRQLEDVQAKKEKSKKIFFTHNEVLIKILQKIIDNIPYDVILNRLFQEEQDIFILEGISQTPNSVTYFNYILNDWIVSEKTILEMLKENEGINKDEFPYQFRIKIYLKEINIPSEIKSLNSGDRE